jgi:hypothetical protein
MQMEDGFMQRSSNRGWSRKDGDVQLHCCLGKQVLASILPQEDRQTSGAAG